MAFALEEVTLERLAQALKEGSVEGGGRPTLFPEAADPRQWERSRSIPEYAPLWARIREWGLRDKDAPIAAIPFTQLIRFGETGDRKAFEKYYFDRRSRLAVYALLFLSEGGTEWQSCLEDAIWAICDEYSWVVSAHIGLDISGGQERVWEQPGLPRETVDLMAAETAFSLAEVISLCGDRLHPWIADRVRQEVDRRVFRVCFRQPAPQLWEQLDNNWPSVCASGAGAAALYLEDDYEQLVGMIWRALQSLSRYIGGFGEDGATSEGITYWHYGFGYFVYFAELLKERTGGRIQLLKGERLAAISRFPNACLLPNGKLVNFSDAPESATFHTGLFRRLRATFPQVRVPSFGPPDDLLKKGKFETLCRDLLWNIGAEGVSAQGAGETDSRGGDRVAAQNDYYPSAGWLISRLDADSRSAVLAIKGGHNGESHNHNDLGHFILHTQGENVLADLGAGLYTRQNFGEERYRLLHNGSQGHSVPIVEGGFQQVGGRHEAKALHCLERPTGVEFMLDLTLAYENRNLRTLTREFVWEWLPGRSDSASAGCCELRLRDSFGFAEPPSSVTEVFITKFEPEQVRPGLLVLNDAVSIEFDAAQFRYELDRLRTTNYLGKEDRVYRILLHAEQPQREFAGLFRFRCRGHEGNSV